MNYALTQPLEARLEPFLRRGLIDAVPTRWQLLQGELEMAPYVVMPDRGDSARYRGAPLGHPLLRQPIVTSQVGLDHFRIGHGLAVPREAQALHLCFVYHEGMPVYDLQLCQTHPAGLAHLRDVMTGIEAGATRRHRRWRRLIDLIIPDASGYRRRFLEPGGFIERAEAFDYPGPEVVAPFLRSEFTSLVAFLRYCHESLEPEPRGPLRTAVQLGALVSRRFREWRIR